MIKKIKPEAVKLSQEEIAENEAARRDALMVTLAGRRMGRIFLDIDRVHSKAEEMLYVVSRIGFLPFRVEARIDINQLDMVGLSPQFERIGTDDVIPVYQIKVEDDGKTITAEKMEDKEVFTLPKIKGAEKQPN